jgi:hypothetical protein
MAKRGSLFVNLHSLIRLEFHGARFSSDGGLLAYLTRHTHNVVRFYNGGGTGEQWTKEDKCALKWARLSCRRFLDTAVRFQHLALIYNLTNFLRLLVQPCRIKHWS